jgi:hypothetical protein
MRGDGRDPKLGRRSELPAVGGSSAAHAASAGSAASQTRDAAGRVAGCAIAASLAGATPHRNGGRGRSRRGGRARRDCPAHPCLRDEPNAENRLSEDLIRVELRGRTHAARGRLTAY